MDLIFNEDTKQFELAKQPYKTVEIMLEQCKIMFQCDKEVSAWKQDKVKRLERRLMS